MSQHVTCEGKMCGKCKPEMYTRLYTVVSPLHASSTARSRCVVGYTLFLRIRHLAPPILEIK